MTDMNREELIGLRKQVQKVIEDGRAFPADVLSAQIVLVFEQAHTPTDDEREVLAELIDPDTSRAGWNANAPDVRDQINGLHIKRGVYRVVDRILAAGFRRTVQGEPSIRVNMDAPIPYVGTTDDFMVNVRPQGEPTDAQVNIPEHLSKRDELGPAVRKFLVEEARAENDKRRADEARRLRAAAATQTGEQA